MGNVPSCFLGCCGRSSNIKIEIQEPSNCQRLQNEEDEVLDEETLESLENLRKEMESPNFDRRLVISRLHDLMSNLQEIKDSNSLLTEQQSSFDNMVKKPINYIVEKWAVVTKTGVPRKMAKLTASVLEKVGQTGFILVGLSFIGSMLNQAMEVPVAAESCIKFLNSIRCLLTILNSNICSHGLDFLPDSPLDSVINEITNGIIVCCSYARERFPTQFLHVEGVNVDLAEISDSLDRAIQRLDLTVGLDIYNEMHRQRTQVITHNENIEDTDKVGIDVSVAEVKTLLQMENHEEKRVAVILHGPGGMGKTTLASNAINALKPSSAHFSYASVSLDSERQDFETQVKDLQSELISQLKGSKFEVRNILAGQQELKTHFSSHSCFIFVDNVVNSCQLDNLFPNEIHTNHTLRILVTSRDVNVRKNIPFDIYHINLYPIDGLRDEPSLALLKKSVDMTGEIEQFRGETQKLEQVAKFCYGIPLLLIQVGKDLKFNRKEYYYSDTLNRLKKADFSPYGSKILDFLLCIFRLLEIDVQTAFLDICVFFVGKVEWERVCCIVGKTAMHILAERSMIRKGYNKVIVHDFLKTMAVKFAKEQRSRFIITIDPEKIGSESVKLSDLLEKHVEEHVDATKIEGLFIHHPILSSNIHVQVSNLPSLRIFESSGEITKSCGEITKSPGEITMEFKEEKGQSSSFDNLCYFSIRADEWQRVVKLLLKKRKSILPLKVLSLRSCRDVEEFPKNLGMIQHLQRLELEICDWDMLKSVSSGIQHLNCLEVLQLSCLRAIESLPEELGQLYFLKSLILVSCRKLKALPSSVSNLNCLIYLDMKGCESIERLPEQLGKLHALEMLNLEDCHNLQGLPQSISELQSLKELHLVGCESITCLPKDICKLGSLETLDLQECHNLQLTTSQLEWMATLKDFRR